MRRLVRLMIFLVLGVTLLAPHAVLAGGEGDLYQLEVEGYRISLEFPAEIRTGENEVHVEILDPDGQAITTKEVLVSASRVQEAAHGEADSHAAGTTEAQGGHGTMTGGHTEPTPAPGQAVTGHEGMAGMTSEGAHEMESVAHEVASVFVLQHETETGKHQGSLHFDQSGEWMLSIQFSTGNGMLEADLPIIVAGTTSRFAVLGGIFGLNVVIMGTAAVLKPGSTKKNLKGNKL
jgi:hypothetical protein